MKQQVAEAEQAKHLRAQHIYMKQQYRAPLPVAGWSSCTQPHHLVEDPRNRQFHHCLPKEETTKKQVAGLAARVRPRRSHARRL